ncbi:cytochrome o ubiquinol oxidase subunit IV [Candidatus Palibaumannia cicadellinicola]|uniref:cytochrome o ubiquinol oxidase subunit IV n=1 Tax=Candidatus Palibaumannia cicadellinicola TaxID=186490 RepID=UPI000301A077|nr:cytochrome o ubiquinol oxidase subunit IV [Candidatus Baumannia cicadellinicola]MBS0032713.1 cytochrome o ubiquinol oxidase subunit IV [Candidatus Baumannia cicadellinicola]MCJ7462297.1 cytochrome o ubiquinol oxidase subunit IV [Candidatus Baumannia cicadellinicola]MCJ7462817.1 cytochrome o ubiquinol oxidase subunit IV [Candidatus Baumannia cicadellinicola]
MRNLNIKNTINNHYQTYIIVFLFSIILTTIPFTIVFNHYFEKHTQIFILVICAIIQIILHLVFFLHLKISPEYQWNIVALAFTVLIIVILIIGSLWIMWHLNYNLMNEIIDYSTI